jgi:hypothetical protein
VVCSYTRNANKHIFTTIELITCTLMIKWDLVTTALTLKWKNLEYLNNVNKSINYNTFSHNLL